MDQWDLFCHSHSLLHVGNRDFACLENNITQPKGVGRFEAHMVYGASDAATHIIRAIPAAK